MKKWSFEIWFKEKRENVKNNGKKKCTEKTSRWEMKEKCDENWIIRYEKSEEKNGNQVSLSQNIKFQVI